MNVGFLSYNCQSTFMVISRLGNEDFNWTDIFETSTQQQSELITSLPIRTVRIRCYYTSEPLGVRGLGKEGTREKQQVWRCKSCPGGLFKFLTWPKQELFIFVWYKQEHQFKWVRTREASLWSDLQMAERGVIMWRAWWYYINPRNQANIMMLCAVEMLT